MSVGNNFEKHAQTSIQVILVAVTIWVGSSIITLRDATIRMEEKNSQLRESVIELKSDMAAIRASMATNIERDVYRQELLKNLEGRVDRLERATRVRNGLGER
jgi:stress response protein SCP2